MDRRNWAEFLSLSLSLTPSLGEYASDALRPWLEVWKLPHLLGKGGATPVADTSPLHLLPEYY